MLRMTNVAVYYGSVRALDSVTLHVDEGELVTLIGSNGAGKSTVLKTVSGLTSPRVGAIEFLNQRIDGMSPTEIVRLGVVHCPEGRRVFPDMTVSENLDMGAYTRSDTDAIAELVAELFGVGPAAAG